MELEEVGIPTGDKCGSIFIDDAFKEWLRNILGAKHYRTLDSRSTKNRIRSHATESGEMRAIMKVFDPYKKKFTKDGRDFKLDLPEPLDNLSLKDHIIDGELTIKA
jgi:hypothetical protein